MDVKFKELEYKYNASDVSVKDFEKLMHEMLFDEKIEVSSWDVYYTQKDYLEHFQRYRMSGDIPELTKKRKVKGHNNWERVEVDLPLDPKRITEDKVEAYLELDGYQKNFKIYKTCFIYMFEHINTVWYSVYNESMNEIGRFVEIEVNKDKIKELGGEYKAFECLKETEQKLLSLGITPQHRLRKSLFEMYVKTDQTIKENKNGNK